MQAQGQEEERIVSQGSDPLIINFFEGELRKPEHALLINGTLRKLEHACNISSCPSSPAGEK